MVDIELFHGKKNLLENLSMFEVENIPWYRILREHKNQLLNQKEMLQILDISDILIVLSKARPMQLSITSNEENLR